MQIIADENIPYVHEFFDRFGSVQTLPGRSMGAADVADADILLVRSVTQVNADLLSSSAVKFVGTCTIGVDHLDLAYLSQRQISYASAPGCNAGGVLQYVIRAVSRLSDDWQSKTFGIVAGGNVGGRLARTLHSIGIECRVYDPFLSSQDLPFLTDLASVLSADVVCFHAPYTVDGPHPTHHMLNRESLKHMKPDAILLNAGRGDVIDNRALFDYMTVHPELKVALDVWENEPHVHLELLDKVHLATPHIAGYSFEGRVMGSAMIFSALSLFLGQEVTLVQAEQSRILEDIFGEKRLAAGATVDEIIASTYDIQADDQRMRAAIKKASADGPQAIASAFDQLRKTYPERHEFSQYCTAAKGPEGALLEALGFTAQ